MTTTMNFKRVEVKGFTKQEALKKVPFNIIRDATSAWKKAGCPISESGLKEFCTEYLQKWTKFAPGIGCSITFETGSSDTREQPCAITDIVNEKGRRKYSTGIQAIDKATGEIKFTCFGTKTDAKKEARKLYTSGYKGDLICKYVKEVTEGEVGAFSVKYTPSKNTKEGIYFAFGVEAN